MLKIGCLVALVTSVGCVSVLPVRKSPEQSPRPVETSLPIGLNPVLFNFEPGRVVGGDAPEGASNYDEVRYWQETFKLRRHAFLKPLREELVANGYRFAIGSQAAYQLKATIEEMVFNRYGEDGHGRGVAGMTVRWAFEGTNGLAELTDGYAEAPGWDNAAVYAAFRASLRAFLANPEVVARFAPRGMPVMEEQPETPETAPEPPRADAPVDRTLALPPQADAPLEEAEQEARTRRGVVTVLAREGWASGVVVSEGGLVVTTSSLVQGASRVNLVLHDGTQHAARLLWVDSERGLALLQGAPGAYEPLRLRAEAARMGEQALAIGTPYHPALSISTSRGSVNQTPGGGVLATDIKISTGNAGGPIVDSRGRVIGVIVAPPSRRRASRARCTSIATVLAALHLSYR